MANKKYTVKKIPIIQLLTALQEAYELGADYIDMTLIQKGKEDRDELLIDIQDDYYMEEEAEEREINDETDFNDLIV